MAYTPEPWQVIPPSDHTENYMIAQVPPANNTAPFYIAAVYTYEPKHRHVDAEANARIMGNAPLMFEALEMADRADQLRLRWQEYETGHGPLNEKEGLALHRRWIRADNAARNARAKALAAARGE